MEKNNSLDKIYVADFETTTTPDDLRVWSWGLKSLANDILTWNKSLDQFFNHLKYKIENNSIVYFHNLKFDGNYILCHLFNNGFIHTKERKLYNNQFKTLISNMGVYYSISVKLNGKKVTFLDSYKIIPLSIAKMSKAFDINAVKGEIDYHKYRPIGYTPTDEEIDYLNNDIEIMRKALLFFYNQNLKKMTIASDALSDYKIIKTKKVFDRLFPQLLDDLELRKAYRGGCCQVKKDKKGIEGTLGRSYDVNSMYPYHMSNSKLPYGKPIWYEGEYKETPFYDLYIQKLVCQFELKKGYLPTLQIKRNMRFVETEYLESSNDLDVMITLTSVDIELFFEHYNVYNVQYVEGWMFRSSTNLFKDYVDKWMDLKIRSKVDGNLGIQTLAKLMLNSLYGKFGLNPNVQSKIPYINEGILKYTLGEPETRPPLYVPVAAFITAYSRKTVIDAAQNNYDRFIYMDTDSIYLEGVEDAEGIDVHSTRLGAWDEELYFKRYKFLRAKSYVVESFDPDKKHDDKLYIKCAGMPETCKESITFDDFDYNLEVDGKLQLKSGVNGSYLNTTTFKIKPVIK